jgi:hypothetical protein
MLRRPFTEVSISRLAGWSSRLAWFALVVAALSVVVVRSGALETVPALITLAAALILALLAVLLAIAAFVSIWQQGHSGLGCALLGFMLGLLLLAYPGYLGFRAVTRPAIYDVSTDAANPPRFVALAAERPSDLNVYPPAFAAAQHASYPNIAQLQYDDASAKLVFDIALALVNKRKWRVAAAEPPGPGRDGRIEATAHSLIMSFADDVVIRIAPIGLGCHVDVRAASRHAWPDLGSNAASAQALLDDIDDAVRSVPQQGPQPKPTPKPAPKRPGEKKK